MVKDPICGMDVDEKKATLKTEHMGQTYYFCGPGCKRTFDQNPAQHVGGHGMGGHGGHGGHH